MNATLTAQERALIDAAVEAGKVTRVPIGASRETTYVWCAKTNQLVRADGLQMSWKAQRRNNAKAALGKRNSVIIEAANKRRDEVERLAAAGMNRREIADALGVSFDTVKKDCQIRKIDCVAVIPPKREGPLTIAVIAAHNANPTATHAEIAAITGAAPGTVRRVRQFARTGK